MKRSRSPKTLPDLVKDDVLAELVKGESARGKVLITGSHVDNLLSVLLKTWLFHSPNSPNAEDELFDRENAPCSTFSAKIKLAYRLGLIGEELKNILDVIRNIRNIFAHQIEKTGWDDEQLKCLSPKLDNIRTLTIELRDEKIEDEKVYHHAVHYCVFYLKHIIGFCKELCKRDKRPDVSSMVYRNIDDTIWSFRERENIAHFFANFQSMENDSRLSDWYIKNEERIKRTFVDKAKRKQAFGVSEISMIELDVPLSQQEQKAREKVVEFSHRHSLQKKVEP